MSEITYAQALNEAIREEMERDPDVICMGEDIGPHGGAFQVTRGLIDLFGKERIISTPISELGFSGLAVGAALKGIRPIVEYMYSDFSLLAMDQIINQAAKLRYMTGGQVEVPIVFRTQGGAGRSNAGQHSQSLESVFYHIPGLKVIMPSNPMDAKGLLKTAIRDNNPVIFIEHKMLYSMKGELSTENSCIPFGKANVIKEGSDLTIVSYSYMAQLALRVAEALADKIDIEVIDIRTLVPLDSETIKRSVKKTNKAVVLQEAVRRGGIASDISSIITEEIFDYLDYPVKIIAGKNTIIPYADNLEEEAVPGEKSIIDEVMNFIVT